MVKNPSSIAGDSSSIPGHGTKIPHVAEQLSLHATTRETIHCKKEPKKKKGGCPVLDLPSGSVIKTPGFPCRGRSCYNPWSGN